MAAIQLLQGRYSTVESVTVTLGTMLIKWLLNRGGLLIQVGSGLGLWMDFGLAGILEGELLLLAQVPLGMQSRVGFT